MLKLHKSEALASAKPNVVPRLSETPGRVNFLGPALGAHNEEIYHVRLILSDQELQQLIDAGVI
jgi:succinyl-CoA:(S)-malate CoA-transferase subunit B